MPGGDFVAVAVLKRSALQFRYLADLIGAERIALPAEDRNRVVAADLPDEPRGPERAHRFENVPLERALCVAEQDDQPVAAAFQNPFRNDRVVQKSLAGARGAGLDVPAVVAVLQEFALL